MFPEYKPSYYANINAETNFVYHSGHPNERAASRTGDGEAVFEIKEHGAEIAVKWENFGGTSTVRQKTVITNKGGEPFVVDTLSALYQCGIGEDADGFRDGRFIIHYAHSCWQGEAQWRHVKAEDLGLYKTYNHGTQTSFRICSQGTWTTCHYEPVLMVEDTLKRKIWTFTVESGSGWAIDVNVRGYRENLSLAVFVSGSYEKNDGWWLKLDKDESYETCAATVNCVEGGFEEAAAELVRYAREVCRQSFPEGMPPLCFNDYMNCIWALPNEEKCIALIDAAAEAGAEYYVIDAGWFGKDENWGTSLGDWNANDRIFGEKGLAGIFRLIESKGMKPGIWLEIESVNMGSNYAKKHPENILRRHGSVIGGSVGFLDYRKREVRDHIESVFDRLYAAGVRYVKNDYNQTVGTGIDGCGPETSMAAELERMTRIFRSFILKIQKKYPDLIIENCGSGAMRSDIGTLSCFHLQSVSDQEDYFRLPSIISGLEALVPPERCGIWAYPYPSRIDDRMTFARPPEFTEQFRDGRVTVYNMVSGLTGLMYLSGRIDLADSFNMALIKEACGIYKENRAAVQKSVPIYPLGTFDMADGGARCFGLWNRDGKKLFLAVFAQKKGAGTAEIDLSAYAGDGALALRRQYPSLPGYFASVSGNMVRATLPEDRSAMFLEFDAG